MENIDNVRSFLIKVLGDNSVRVFDEFLDDFYCSIKSWSLTDLKTPLPDMKVKIESIVKGILAESVKVYLGENFREINIFESNVFDKNMNEIPAISIIRSNNDKIIKILTSSAMELFENGRKLANEIVSRSILYSKSKTNGNRIEIKKIDTPKESYEIEVIQLEKLLPNIDKLQAKRLSNLYSLLKETKCAGT